MKIPRYITHPTLFALVSAGLMYALWLQSPSANDIQTVAQNTSDTQARGTADLLKQDNLHQITELLPQGYVIIDGVPQKLQINHERFKKLTEEQAERFKDFFVGKFVKLGETKSALTLELPLDLYEPNCFSSDPNVVALSKQCPLTLQP